MPKIIKSGYFVTIFPKLSNMMWKFITNNRGILSQILHSSKMPAFTLYGARGSTNTDRVRLTLAEGGFTDYELVLINLQKGEQKVRKPTSAQSHVLTSPRTVGRVYEETPLG